MSDSSITPFLFEGQNLVRVIVQQGRPWFVAADVCRVLELSNPSKAVESLDDDEKASITLTNGEGNRGNPNVNIISESGLYALIFRSRKPAAQRFRKWVTGEVLPTLRQTGSYSIPDQPQIDGLPDHRRDIAAWSMEELRARKGVVDMYRHVFGMPSAQWIAPQLGFPLPPPSMIQTSRQLDLFPPEQTEAD